MLGGKRIAFTGIIRSIAWYIRELYTNWLFTSKITIDCDPRWHGFNLHNAISRNWCIGMHSFFCCDLVDLEVRVATGRRVSSCHSAGAGLTGCATQATAVTECCSSHCWSNKSPTRKGLGPCRLLTKMPLVPLRLCCIICDHMFLSPILTVTKT